MQTLTNVERATKCEHYCIIEEYVKYEEKQQNFKLRKRTGMSVRRALFNANHKIRVSEVYLPFPSFGMGTLLFCADGGERERKKEKQGKI